MFAENVCTFELQKRQCERVINYVIFFASNNKNEMHHKYNASIILSQMQENKIRQFNDFIVPPYLV